jgi:uncharacterized protein YdaU (DUF1376 family)
MAEFNMLPLYTDTFISDTIDLDATESGAYLMLLMCAWRSPDCRLPNDEVRLARFARCDGRTWRRIRDVVMGFWTTDAEGFWVNPKLSKVRESCNTSRENKRRGAEAAREAKALKTHIASPAEQEPIRADISLQTVSVSHREEREPKAQPLEAARAGDEVVAIRKEIVAAVCGAMPPGDMGRVAMWVAQGYSPAIIRAVVVERIRAGKRPGSLGWFDKALAEAASVKAPELQPEQRRSYLTEVVDDAEWRKRMTIWKSSQGQVWPMSWGPRPQLTSTKVPDHIRDEFDVIRVIPEEVA